MAGNRRETETFYTLQKEASKDGGIKYEEGITEEVRSGSQVEGIYTEEWLTLGKKENTLRESREYSTFLESTVTKMLKFQKSIE